ncbi:unnamed protein product [Thlaspi arvense]|uniref:S-protein homolog n=1 Tax=Thlaspi arvense TaxID=13288 RepID=A0AAU9SRV3_THLAR|nr:unnamed protein product [Thlaspi arvense]
MVMIINQLGDGSTLNLHCNSTDDDFGFKILAPNKSWSFYFRPNIWRSTRWCLQYSSMRDFMHLLFLEYKQRWTMQEVTGVEKRKSFFVRTLRLRLLLILTLARRRSSVKKAAADLDFGQKTVQRRCIGRSLVVYHIYGEHWLHFLDGTELVMFSPSYEYHLLSPRSDKPA